jgi:hypothetical protein
MITIGGRASPTRRSDRHHQGGRDLIASASWIVSNVGPTQSAAANSSGWREELANADDQRRTDHPSPHVVNLVSSSALR